METCWLLGFTCYQVYHSLVPFFLCANSWAHLYFIITWDSAAERTWWWWWRRQHWWWWRIKWGGWVLEFQLHLPLHRHYLPPLTRSDWLIRWGFCSVQLQRKCLKTEVWILLFLFFHKFFFDIWTLWKQNLTSLWVRRRLDIKKPFNDNQPLHVSTEFTKVKSEPLCCLWGTCGATGRWSQMPRIGALQMMNDSC